MSVEAPEKRRSMLLMAENSLRASERLTDHDRPDVDLATTYALQSIAASLLLIARSESQR